MLFRSCFSPRSSSSHRSESTHSSARTASADREEFELFKLLITVNGVGAKAGMAIMNILPQTQLRRVIATGDAKAITAANGIGKKTAERIILELKDKVGEFVPEEGISETEIRFVPGNRRAEADSSHQPLKNNGLS